MTTKVLRKEKCPLCEAEGRDISEDNLAVYDDGHTYCYAGHGLVTKGDSKIEDFTYEYIPHRGLTSNTLSFFGIKTKVDGEGKPIEDGFRYPNSSYKVRSLKDKHFWWKGASAPGLFGMDKFSSGGHKYITITEGEYDAATIWQVVRTGAAVSVRSSSSAANDCIAARSFINAHERIYLAFDNDAAGRDATREVARLFDYNKVYIVKFDKRKDANEYLQHGEEQELINIWNNAKRYLPETIVSSFKEFGEILSTPPKYGVAYPFKQLTDMTYGIRTGETVLLKAQEKVGKTELMHFIEYQILKETTDNVAAIFLEEPKQRHLQALAGIELHRPVHLPDSGVAPAEVIKAVQSVISADDRLHIYSHFGTDDPEVLLDTIRFLVTARDCKYVIFDHITMAVSGLAGEDERRALDYLSTRLEMMVKELDFALIMVSHVNDEGKTRGSRYLTKVADIVIDAVRDTMADDYVERNTIRLAIPFNRFCGRTGQAGKVIFVPDEYKFIEQMETEYVDSPSIDPSREAIRSGGASELALQF